MRELKSEKLGNFVSKKNNNNKVREFLMTLNFVSFFFLRENGSRLYLNRIKLYNGEEKRGTYPSFFFAILTKARTARLHRKNRLAKEIK